MKTGTKRKTLAVLLVGQLAWFACTENPAEPQTQGQPELPPAQALSIEMDYFIANSWKAAQAGDAVLAKDNFTEAVNRVLQFNLLVIAQATIPMATFAAILTQQPTLGEDGKYHWVYTMDLNGTSLKADLSGVRDSTNGEAIWEMRITYGGMEYNLEDFLWYSGRSGPNNKTGYWTIYDPSRPDSTHERVLVQWQVDSDTTSMITFSVLTAGETQNDQVTFYRDGAGRKMLLYDSSADATTEIGWNVETGEGYIQAADYNEGAKACWDASKNDVACSSD